MVLPFQIWVVQIKRNVCGQKVNLTVSDWQWWLRPWYCSGTTWSFVFPFHSSYWSVCWSDITQGQHAPPWFNIWGGTAMHQQRRSNGDTIGCYWYASSSCEDCQGYPVLSHSNRHEKHHQGTTWGIADLHGTPSSVSPHPPLKKWAIIGYTLPKGQFLAIVIFHDRFSITRLGLKMLQCLCADKSVRSGNE